MPPSSFSGTGPNVGPSNAWKFLTQECLAEASLREEQERGGIEDMAQEAKSEKVRAAVGTGYRPYVRSRTSKKDSSQAGTTVDENTKSSDDEDDPLVTCKRGRDYSGCPLGFTVIDGGGCLFREYKINDGTTFAGRDGSTSAAALGAKNKNYGTSGLDDDERAKRFLPSDFYDHQPLHAGEIDAQTKVEVQEQPEPEGAEVKYGNKHHGEHLQQMSRDQRHHLNDQKHPHIVQTIYYSKTAQCGGGPFYFGEPKYPQQKNVSTQKIIAGKTRFEKECKAIFPCKLAPHAPPARYVDVAFGSLDTTYEGPG
ncbi:unnamed protein product, partial [Amoebophrya sp. A25]|eukprot:GSA25T00010259001.1